MGIGHFLSAQDCIQDLIEELEEEIAFTPLAIRRRLVLRDHSVFNPEKFKDSHPSEPAIHRKTMPESVAKSRRVHQQMHRLTQPKFRSFGYFTNHLSSVFSLDTNDSSKSILSTLRAELATAEQEAVNARNDFFLANLVVQKTTQQRLQYQLQIEASQNSGQNHAEELTTTRYATEVHAHPFLNSRSFPPSVDPKIYGSQYMATDMPVSVRSMEPSVAVGNEINSYNAQLTPSFPKQFFIPSSTPSPETQGTNVKHTEISPLSNPMVTTMIQNSAPVPADFSLTNCTLLTGAKAQSHPDNVQPYKSTISGSHTGAKKRKYRKQESQNDMPRRPLTSCKSMIFLCMLPKSI